MTFQIAAHRQLDVALRQTEEAPTDRAPPAARWFYIVDVEATATGDSHALRDGRVVLGLSVTEADASAATDADGLGVVYYAELSEDERQSMTARIDERQHTRG